MGNEFQDEINEQYRETWAFIGELKRKAERRTERRINTIFILIVVCIVLHAISAVIGA